MNIFKMKIFISYAVADESIAKKLGQLISQVGRGFIEPWAASIDGLEIGNILINKIHEELLESDGILIITTPNSVNRPWVMYESGFVSGLAAKNTRTKGRKKNGEKLVIPVLFQMTKESLPRPLSDYLLFYGDEVEDLKELLYQIIGIVMPDPEKEKERIKNSAEDFVKTIEPDLKTLEKAQEETVPAPVDMETTSPVSVIDRYRASQILHERLGDPRVKTVQIVAYTNEVEAGTIAKIMVQGPKLIEVFKRSISNDYADEQLHNIRQLFSTGKPGTWRKSELSLVASRHLETVFEGHPSINVREYFYDGPPIKRAYIFDGREAIFSYYEIHTDAAYGSIYKGMTDRDRIWITDKTKVGEYLLDELKEMVNILRYNSRDWKAEQLLLENPSLGNAWHKIPYYDPKVVFMDMDGVLYDSLPLHVKACVEAFRKIGVEIPEKDIYWHGGCSSTSTVKMIMQKIGRRLSQEQIKSVVDDKRNIYDQLDKPPCQIGAKELLREIRTSGFPVFIVTSSTKPELNSELRSDFVDIKDIISGRDVTHSKPHPEPYLSAYKRAGISPNEAIVIENAPLGIQSAAASGALCIAINTSILDDQDLKDAGASIVVKSHTELAKHWQQLVKCLRWEE